MEPTLSQLPTHVIRRLAVLSDSDPRTVRKEIRQPGSVRGATGDRVRRVIAAEHAQRSESAGQQNAQPMRTSA